MDLLRSMQGGEATLAFLKMRKKAVTTIVLFLLLFCTMSTFNVILSGINYNAAAFNNAKKQSLDIPSDLNFVDDDKRTFLNYCEKIYGNEKPYAVDTLSYCYYGTLSGRRLYRFNATFIPYATVYNESNIGGYIFSSAVLYRPYSLGLYVIDGQNVYTLQQAYERGVINISKAHELYLTHGKS